MKRLLLFIILSVATATVAKAGNKDRIVLKNGKTYSGYISCQMPDKQQIIFISDNLTIPLDINEVKQIERDLREDDILLGLDDVIETQNGDIIRGQIYIQVFGKSFYIKTSESIRTIPLSDIRIQRKEKVNSDLDLFSQAPYIDVVDCGKTKYQGVITKQDYGNDSIDSYLVVTDSMNVAHEIPIKNIRNLLRTPNQKYKEIKKFNVVPGNVYFNQVAGKRVSIDEKKNHIILNGDLVKGCVSIITKDNKLIIETDDTPKHRKMTFAKMQGVSEGKDIKYRKKDLDKQDPVKYSAVDGLLKWEYNVSSDNLYLFYSEDFHNSYFVTILYSK